MNCISALNPFRICIYSVDILYLCFESIPDLYLQCRHTVSLLWIHSGFVSTVSTYCIFACINSVDILSVLSRTFRIPDELHLCFESIPDLYLQCRHEMVLLLYYWKHTHLNSVDMNSLCFELNISNTRWTVSLLWIHSGFVSTVSTWNGIAAVLLETHTSQQCWHEFSLFWVEHFEYQMNCISALNPFRICIYSVDMKWYCCCTIGNTHISTVLTWILSVLSWTFRIPDELYLCFESIPDLYLQCRHEMVLLLYYWKHTHLNSVDMNSLCFE